MTDKFLGSQPGQDHPVIYVQEAIARRMKPAPEAPPTPKSPVISRERAQYDTYNTIQEMIGESTEPARSCLLKAQQRVWRALENL